LRDSGLADTLEPYERLSIKAKTAPTFTEVAEIPSSTAGRSVELAVVDETNECGARPAAQWSSGLASPSDSSKRPRRAAGVDPLLAELLGREPQIVDAALN